MGDKLTKEQIEAIRDTMLPELYATERIKAMNALCNLALAAIEGEDVWCVVAPSGFCEEYFSTEETARIRVKAYEAGWTVAKYRLVPVKEG